MIMKLLMEHGSDVMSQTAEVGEIIDFQFAFLPGWLDAIVLS